jgi:large subunit ribosomal protein L25
MRKDITVAAEPRSTRGKNEARRLRVRELSPAVLYGDGKDPVSVAVSPKQLEKIMHSASGRNTVFNLDVQGVENSPVMIVDTQRDPIKGRLLHADLLRIDLAKPLVVNIPVHLTGLPKGVKQQGGTLEVVTRTIAVQCLAEEIPEHFTADVSEMELNQSLRAGEIALTGTMTLVGHADQVLAHVVGHKEEAAPAEAEGATAEPEVVKKGKKEAEGGDAKAGAGAKAAAPAKDAKKK